MKFSAVVGVLFGLVALACAFLYGTKWHSPDPYSSVFVLGGVGGALISGFFVHAWGRQSATDDLAPSIPEGTVVTVCGGAQVTNPRDTGYKSWQYTVEFHEFGWGLRTRTIFPSQINLPLMVNAANGDLPVGTKLVMRSGWLVPETQTTADTSAPSRLSRTPTHS